ncbi:GIY-YIG nuclease family protein [Cupriavidus pauculus]|uniref:GIY-YIG nuclease family protein n=1 Tax=Cupriavidus pauculus TaxID=82633 RepID=A0A3G8H6W7_9BURK|nr:GIY-YIG nuclease family protein [Cupriavidus pauculus]AZG16166.1 GIY-YIG nuclease family protein [Cupriavidus pauculus]
MIDDNDASPTPPVPWFLYLLECEGNTIYTGITTDVQRRYAQHVAGTGAKYTRSRKPLRLLGWLAFPSQSDALKAEIQTKRLTAAQKRAMCADLVLADLAEPAAQ